MKHTTLGKTGLSVSEVGFGCAPLGDEYGAMSDHVATMLVHQAIDAGINLFDTSPYYGRTLSETRLGAALKGRRDQVILATKAGRFDFDLESGFDFSYNNVIRMCQESLRRLQTDWIDIYQLHDIEFGRQEVILEGVRALAELKRQGKVRCIGVTGYPVALLRQMVETTGIDVTLSYCHGNLMNQQLDTILVPAVQRHGVGLINASVTHMGILTPQGPPPWHPASEEVKKVGRLAAALCGERGVSIADLAIQYALQNPHVDTTLLGSRTEAELTGSLALLDRPIDDELLHDVQAIIEPVRNRNWPSGHQATWEEVDA